MFPSPREAGCSHHRGRSYKGKADLVTRHHDDKGCVNETEALASLPFHLDLAVEKQRGSGAASSTENRDMPVWGAPAPWMSQEEERAPPRHRVSGRAALRLCFGYFSISHVLPNPFPCSLVSPALCSDPSCLGCPQPHRSIWKGEMAGKLPLGGQGACVGGDEKENCKAFRCPLGQQNSCEVPWH